MTLEYLIYVCDASWTLGGWELWWGGPGLLCSRPVVVLVLGRAGVPFVSVGLKVGVCCCCRDLI